MGRLLGKGGLFGYPEGTSGTPLGPYVTVRRVPFKPWKYLCMRILKNIPPSLVEE